MTDNPPPSVTQDSLDAAILAMHAYNVGPQPHVVLSDESVGDFVFQGSLSSGDGFVGSEFLKGGQGYMAIRGTDRGNLTSFAADARYGYALGAGYGAEWSSDPSIPWMCEHCAGRRWTKNVCFPTIILGKETPSDIGKQVSGGAGVRLHYLLSS